MNYLFKYFSAERKPVILFYGSKGWIGSLFMDFVKKKYPKIKIFEGTARLDNKKNLLIEINVVNPTHIISFTGRTHGTIDGKIINTIDYLEYPGKLVENINDNLYGPVNLAMICQKNKIHYTYFPKSIDDYKLSKLRFFSIELTYNDEIYQIELINNIKTIYNKPSFYYQLHLTFTINRTLRLQDGRCQTKYCANITNISL